MGMYIVRVAKFALLLTKQFPKCSLLKDFRHSQRMMHIPSAWWCRSRCSHMQKRNSACSPFASREIISGQTFFLLLYDFATVSKLCIWELCALKKVTRLFLSSYPVSGSHVVAIGEYNLRGRWFAGAILAMATSCTWAIYRLGPMPPLLLDHAVS